MIKSVRFSVSAAMLLGSLSAFAVTTTYETRASFLQAAGPVQIDDFENPGYSSFMTDQQMSAVLGLTRFTATFFPNNNGVFEDEGNAQYCAGCNASFALDFTAPSLGGAAGVVAVAVDLNNVAAFVVNPIVSYFAFVSFTDGSSRSFALPNSPDYLARPREFFGIKSDVGITRIAFGQPNGQPQIGGFMSIDNLTVGAMAAPVPEPATTAMLATGLAIMGWLAVARRRQTTRA